LNPHPRALELARKAKTHDLNFTVDAGEADRLDLPLDGVGAVLRDPGIALENQFVKLLTMKA
jgi:RHH-type proline utilization regulon transcriptional repressor/proline dehydrogenase/delta 1-pyrroline-5-carboxylate dehydrogenase